MMTEEQREKHRIKMKKYRDAHREEYREKRKVYMRTYMRGVYKNAKERREQLKVEFEPIGLALII